MIRYLDKAITPLVLKLPKVIWYVKTFKVKDGQKDENYKLMSFNVGDEKLLEKYITTWNKIEDLKNINLNDWTVYDDRYIKTKTRTYGDKTLCWQIHVFLYLVTRFVYYIFTVHILKPYSRLTKFYQQTFKYNFKAH